MPFNKAISSLSARLFLWLGLITFLFGLASCSFFFKEKKKETEVSYNNKIGSCIGEVNSSLSLYFSREDASSVGENELNAFSNCYQESMESFITYTKSGRLESDDYSAENIDLLLKRFHPEVSLNVERIRGYIRLKAFLIGGEEETISKEELRAIQKLVPLIAKGLINLKDHRATWMRLRKSPQTPEGYEEFNQAFELLKSEVGTVLASLDEYQGSREVDINEVSTFLLKEIFGSDFGQYLKYQSLIEKFKNFVVNEEGETLQRGNLSLFARQALLTYEAVTRFDFFLKEEGDDAIFTNIGKLVSFITSVPDQLHSSDLFKGVGLRALNDIYNAGEAVLTYSIRTRPQRKIPIQTFQEVLYSFEEAEIMGGTLTAGTLGYFIRGFSKKWLHPGGPEDSDFTLEKVHYVKTLLEKWVRRQQIANTLFANSTGDSVSLLNYENQLPDQPEMIEWFEIFRKGTDNKEVSTHQWDDHRRVVYSRDINHFDYEELTVSNSISLLVEIFMKPFNVSEENPLHYKVTASQAQEIYESMRVLGVELAFMDSRVDDSGHRAFRETNNFSTQINSDSFLDFYEGYEYLAVAMNSGALADWIYSEIPKTEECTRELEDVHRHQVIEAECFRPFLRENFLRYFGHLTTIANYWRGANDLDKTVFLRSLEVASRAGLIREKPYDLSEIRVAVSILSYLQSIFYMFDLEHRNGLVDGIEATPGDSELRRAEMHFRPLIVSFLVDLRPDLLLDNAWLIGGNCGDIGAREDQLNCLANRIAANIFIQLLRRGDLPFDGLNDVCGAFTFGRDTFEIQENVSFKTTRATPGDVLKVFSSLSKITLSSHRGRVKKFIQNRHDELFQRLSPVDPPDCRENPDHVFCRWGREMYCSESILPDVYKTFRDNRYEWFSSRENDYANTPDETSARVMLEIYSLFTDGPRSTLCAFPPVFADGEKGFFGKAYEDCVTGGEDGAGLLERGGQLLDDIGQGISDIWNSF